MTLWYKLEETLLDRSRYGLIVLADAKTRKSAKSNERQAGIRSAKEAHEDLQHIIEDYERERAGTEALWYEPDLPNDDYEDLLEEELACLEAD